MGEDIRALIAKYDRPVPRYTSYPPATKFTPAVGPGEFTDWLRGAGEAPASLYVHLPFCARLCHYCGCHMTVTRNRDRMKAYVDAVLREADTIRDTVGRKMAMHTLHFGGGTPTYNSADELKRLIAGLRARFDILPDAEVSVEIDPRQFDAEKAAVLAAGGVTRASLGVQDTDTEVQAAIGRIQSVAVTQVAMDALRAVGIHAINLDLIYGLPKQTEASVRGTVAQVVKWRPLRVAIYGYAHVPWVKPHQKVLEQHDLPDAEARLRLAALMKDLLLDAGYEAVGIDHFALPEDGLRVALGEGKLGRNFMGYVDRDDSVLVGLGASSISQLPAGFAQNETDINAYVERVTEGRLATCRGYSLKPEDAAPGQIIKALMCHAAAEIGAPTAEALAKLQPLLDDGLAVWEGTTLRVTERGMPWLRVVAACFDPYYKPVAGQHARAA